MADQIFGQILSAARDNDVEGVESLLKIGCPAGFANKMGQTALHIGAMWGGADAIRVLLKARANPNQRNQLRAQTPLHCAVSGRGDPDKCADCIKVLIEFKGNPGQLDQAGQSPLDCAEDEVLRLALGGAPMIIHNAVKEHRLQELKDAVEQVRLGKVQNLTLDSSSGDENTALHNAVASGWEEAVQLLLSASANPSMENGKQKAPVHTAVLSGNNTILLALLKSKANVAATDRDLDHDFRFSSSTFKETPENHRTALHYAASLGNEIAIRALLESKANVNDKDSHSKSPLHLALEFRISSEIDTGCGVRVSGLQSKPEWNDCVGVVLGPPVLPASDVNESNVRCPVLLQGQDKGVLLKPSNLKFLHEESLDLLLAAKADVNASNHSLGGRSVLHEASRVGDASLAQKLIEAQANLDQVDSKNGLSALHLAARGKHSDVVRILVHAKAQVGLAASSGKTAVDFLKANGASTEILDLLNVTDAPKDSPMVSAKQDTLAGLTKEQMEALYIA